MHVAEEPETILIFHARCLPLCPSSRNIANCNCELLTLTACFGLLVAQCQLYLFHLFVLLIYILFASRLRVNYQSNFTYN
jgi:hypothetical protein